MVNTDVFTKPPFLIKILELVLGVICLGLTSGNFSASTLAKTEVVHAAYIGFFMVTSIVVISYILDAPIKGILMMVISFCGGVMYFTAGALNIEFYDKTFRDGKILGAGITGLLTGLVFLGDFFLSWRNK